MSELPVQLGYKTKTQEAIVSAAVLIAIAFMFIWPALINKFPLVFYDTSTYLVRAKVALDSLVAHDVSVIQNAAAHSTETGEPGYVSSDNPFFLRPFTYSLFLMPFASGATFYLAPIAQGLLCAYLLKRLFALFGVKRNATLLMLGATIALFSSLPIHASYLMPDVFTGALVVASFVTVASWAHRSTLARLFDIGLMSFLVAVHLSHIPIALALIVMHAAICLVFRDQFNLKAVGAGLVAPLAIAIAALVGSNFVVANKPVISESSSLFLLARLIGDGPALEHLKAACPTKQYVLCTRLDELNARDQNGSISDFFLWAPEGAVKQLGSARMVAEADEITTDTLQAYPMEIAQHATWNFIRQLATFQVDDDANNPPADFVTSVLRRVDEPLAAQYLASEQSQGRFPLRAARVLTVLGIIAGVIAIAYMTLARRRNVTLPAWLFLLIAATGAGANALAIGALSEVHDRYQNRVIWLVPVAALILILSALPKQRAP
ncbi:hypothetical protein M9M90_07225 [Phenylobacterium sp. LH3H17]|uniref:hypothetical protein n=1 Tax=Phenylobacterium sp. LH3H17 TaxID=2903901 RepID=UPI0020C98499|nr:hypothetical protein [Phenylobacterium sp. LH3H17]UTP40966.1 hypothetical protein M9M90_07225 [Phenylobacterium sp. LH3H17]